MHDENSEKILIEEWEPLLKQIPSEDIKQRLTMIFLKMYAENCAKKPLKGTKFSATHLASYFGFEEAIQ